MNQFDRVLTFAVGALIIGGALFLGAGAARDALRFPEEPIQMTVTQAALTATAGRQWVSILPGAWRCADEVRLGILRLVPATTTEGALVVARFEGPVSCQSATARPVTGVIEEIDGPVAERLVSAGVLTHREPTVHQLNVCTHCGRDNARLGVLICSLFVLLGVSLGPLRRLIGGWQQGLVTKLDSAAREPANSEQANDTVRRHGFLVTALCGLGVAVGADWVVFGVIPLRWFAGGGAVLGAFMLTFPEQYRRLRRRGRPG